MKLSYANTLATATITGSTSNTSFPATNLYNAHRPGRPAKMTVITDSSWVADFGTATALDVLWLGRANFTTLTIQGHADTAHWGAPSFTQAITLARCGVTSRFQGAYALAGPGAFNYRYLRLFVGAQTPQAGEGDTGAFRAVAWAGTLTAEYGLAYGPQVRRVDAFADRKASNGRVVQRAQVGDPIARLSLTRLASVAATPGLADDVATWQDVVRQWTTYDYSLVWLQAGDATQAWVMRRLDDDEWPLEYKLAKSALVAEEVYGP